MKKLILFLAAIVMLTVTACSHKPSDAEVDAVVAKIHIGTELSQDDYAVMLDYMESALNEFFECTHKVAKAIENEDQEKAIKIANGEAYEYRRKYKYGEIFQNCISANHEEFDSSNLKKYEKLENKVNEIDVLYSKYKGKWPKLD